MLSVHLAAQYTAFSPGRKIVFEKISEAFRFASLKFFQNSNLRLSLKMQIAPLSNERAKLLTSKYFF